MHRETSRRTLGEIAPLCLRASRRSVDSLLPAHLSSIAPAISDAVHIILEIVFRIRLHLYLFGKRIIDIVQRQRRQILEGRKTTTESTSCEIGVAACPALGCFFDDDDVGSGDAG